MPEHIFFLRSMFTLEVRDKSGMSASAISIDKQRFHKNLKTAPMIVQTVPHTILLAIGLIEDFEVGQPMLVMYSLVSPMSPINKTPVITTLAKV